MRDTHKAFVCNTPLHFYANCVYYNVRSLSLDGGITTDGQTVYINASMCDIRYSPEQHPIVFDMESVSEETVLESAPSQWTLSDPRERAI